MRKLRGSRYRVGIIVLLAALIPTAVAAYTICNTYNDGCTICDFYGPDNRWRGYIEWCN